MEYFGEKIEESEKFKKVAQKLEGYNLRQVALLEHFLTHDEEARPEELVIRQKNKC